MRDRGAERAEAQEVTRAPARRGGMFGAVLYDPAWTTSPSSAIWRSPRGHKSDHWRRGSCRGGETVASLTSSIRVDHGRMAPGLAGLRVGAFWEPGDPALI